VIKSNEAILADRTPAIEIRGLSKTFGKGNSTVEAIIDLDLVVQAGQVFGFLGPNGAGKSTTIRRPNWASPCHVPSAIGLGLTLLLLGWVIWRVRRIQLPQEAGFFTALRATPLIVVILLDLLDMSLDFLSAPIAWTLLSYLGLAPLRGVTVVASLIPGTQLLPTMSIFWIISRIFLPEATDDENIVEGSWRELE
jgi:hypothetical protein